MPHTRRYKVTTRDGDDIIEDVEMTVIQGALCFWEYAANGDQSLSVAYSPAYWQQCELAPAWTKPAKKDARA